MAEINGGICPSSGLPCKEVIELAAKVGHIEAAQKETTTVVKDLGKSVNEILEFQGGTKVYVVEIKKQIDGLDTKLFAFMGDLVKNLTSNEAKGEVSASTERQKMTTEWMGFAKIILIGTIFAIVAYLFTK